MRLIGLIAPTLLITLFWFTLAQPPAIAKGQDFLVLPMAGVIHGGTVELLKKALREVESSYQGLIIELDTPGGLLESTREMVKLMLNSPVPIIVFVGPSGARAGSAGTFITLAAHIAVMAPGTNIGAAHPITITGKDPEKDGDKHLSQKIENDTLAFIESIAKQRGRNIEWAKKSVAESSSITNTKALELKVIDLVAKDIPELLKQINGKRLMNGAVTLKTETAKLITLQVPIALRFLNLLASPQAMFLLIIVFVLGLYVEFSHPGLLLPGIMSAIALILLLVASRTIPVNTFGIMLLFIGIILLVVEIYVTSFGLLGASGLACFFFGSLLLFDPQKTDLRIPISMITAATVTIGAIALAVGWLIMNSFKLPAVSGQEKMIGEIGSVIEKLPGDQYRVFVSGEYWQAQSESSVVLSAGDKIKVKSLQNLLLKVEKV